VALLESLGHLVSFFVRFSPKPHIIITALVYLVEVLEGGLALEGFEHGASMLSTHAMWTGKSLWELWFGRFLRVLL
jgi:hypothetical protein